ncbi:MAG: metalloregulator ArsR/SmtB family transcription factor [Syntrophomonadaceae bacterium]|nr:metalloregulator ArsR/SmtB family transcription factor [Syntrophomonadaceae bacterium]
MFETFFKALGEPTRLRIVRMLAEQELCVCELEEILQASQPRISQHLKILKQAGLVSERREGQKRMCKFNQGYYYDVMAKFGQFMQIPLNEIPEFKEEYRRMCDITSSCCK